jgi:hypothetical protein
MGAKPWNHFTPYQSDINSALQSLKEQEFRAGRYGFDYWVSEITAVMRAFRIPGMSVLNAGLGVAQNVTKPSADELIRRYGSVQAAIEALLEESAESGTQSVLDMVRVSSSPDTCTVCPLSEEDLQSIFQTLQPSHRMIEAILVTEEDVSNPEGWSLFWDCIGNGDGRYVIVYEGERPTEIFFAGYSFD